MNYIQEQWSLLAALRLKLYTKEALKLVETLVN
jgi:hypothetical protein